MYQIPTDICLRRTRMMCPRWIANKSEITAIFRIDLPMTMSVDSSVLQVNHGPRPSKFDRCSSVVETR